MLRREARKKRIAQSLRFAAEDERVLRTKLHIEIEPLRMGRKHPHVRGARAGQKIIEIPVPEKGHIGPVVQARPAHSLFAHIKTERFYDMQRHLDCGTRARN